MAFVAVVEKTLHVECTQKDGEKCNRIIVMMVLEGGSSSSSEKELVVMIWPSSAMRGLARSISTPRHIIRSRTHHHDASAAATTTTTHCRIVVAVTYLHSVCKILLVRMASLE